MSHGVVEAKMTIVGSAAWRAMSAALLENCVISIILLSSLLHLIVHWMFYAGVLLHAMMRSDHKRQGVSRAILAAVMFVLMMAYNAFLYSIVFATMNWSNLFTSNPWARSVIKDQSLALVLFIEPCIYIGVSSVKVLSAIAQMLYAQADSSVLTRISLKARTHAKSAPEVIVVIPVYNEPFPRLMMTIESIANSSYPKSRLRILIAFDDDQITPVFTEVANLISQDEDSPREISKSVVYGLFRGVRVDCARFVHGGKRHAQMCAFVHLQNLLKDQVSKPLLLFLDSDIKLHESAIAHLVYELNERRNCEALTGVITIDTAGILATLQDIEYIDSQVMYRSTESMLGGVSCLPGALAMIRFESLRVVAADYFATRMADSALDYAKRSLGEDRFLTTLLLESGTVPNRIGFAIAAHCETEGCPTFAALLRQRRRWFLGTIANEVLQFLLSLRNGPLFLYLALSEILLAKIRSDMYWALGALAAIQLPIWALVSIMALHLGKGLRCFFGFPFYLMTMPLFGAIFEIYGIATFRGRSWGGPRTDAAAGAAAADNDNDNFSISKVADSLESI